MTNDEFERIKKVVRRVLIGGYIELELLYKKDSPEWRLKAGHLGYIDGIKHTIKQIEEFVEKNNLDEFEKIKETLEGLIKCSAIIQDVAPELHELFGYLDGIIHSMRAIKKFVESSPTPEGKPND